MEGLGNLFGSIGGWLGQGASAATGAAPNWTKLLTGGMLGAGELGNILQGQKQSAMQDYMAKLAKNPQLLSQMILKAQQPISAAETQSINNQVQGDMAQRGLSQAPGIFAGTEAQALAPLQQANYNTAQQQVMQQLGLYGASSQGQPTNLSPAMQAFMRSFGGNTGTGGQTNQVVRPADWTVPAQGGGIVAPSGMSGSGISGVPPGSWSTPPDTTDWGWGS